MKLNNYSARDLNMYLEGTFSLHNDQPIYIRSIEVQDGNGDCLSHDEDLHSREYFNDNAESVVFYYDKKVDGEIRRDHFTLNYQTDNFPLIPATLGYRETNNTVVFLYKKQYNHYKKLPTNHTVKQFFPQVAEFNYLGKHLDYNSYDALLNPTKYYTLEEAFDLLKEKKRYALPLHRNYALVKKGKYRNPVIYYMADPVIEYDGENFTPLIDQCHVDKFKLEVNINENRL